MRYKGGERKELTKSVHVELPDKAGKVFVFKEAREDDLGELLVVWN